MGAEKPGPLRVFLSAECASAERLQAAVGEGTLCPWRPELPPGAEGAAVPSADPSDLPHPRAPCYVGFGLCDKAGASQRVTASVGSEGSAPTPLLPAVFLTQV